MRGTLGMGIFATLLSLAGCGSSATYDAWSGDRKTENPPPKPPNCPSLPDLSNVTRADGSTIDVRIIQIDDVKLYVPRSWNRWTDGDEFARKHPTTDSPLGLFDPDIHATECPGVVHKWVSKRAMFDLGWRFVLRRSNAEPIIKPNFSVETKVDGLSIVRPVSVTEPKVASGNVFEDGFVDGANDMLRGANIVLVPDHLVGAYPWLESKPVGSPEWDAARADVIELFEWLRTPPTKRDNDRIFKLGVR